MSSTHLLISLHGSVGLSAESPHHLGLGTSSDQSISSGEGPREKRESCFRARRGREMKGRAPETSPGSQKLSGCCGRTRCPGPGISRPVKGSGFLQRVTPSPGPFVQAVTQTLKDRSGWWKSGLLLWQLGPLGSVTPAPM